MQERPAYSHLQRKNIKMVNSDASVKVFSEKMLYILYETW